MSEVTIIGIDLAKRAFHLHSARVDGSVVFRKKLSRVQLLAFFTQHPRCIVAMEPAMDFELTKLVCKIWTQAADHHPASGS